MFSVGTGHIAVLLLFFIKSFAFATLKDDVSRAGTLGKNITSLLQIPWINGIDSFTRSTESSCVGDLAVISDAIESGETWVLQMIDASSKIQSGILRGNVQDLGMYDECVEVNEVYNGSHIRGQHCMVSISPLTSSVCVPSSCDVTDVSNLVNSVMQNVSGINQLNLTVSSVSCARVENEDFTAGEIVTIIFLSLVVIFILFCTACGFVDKSKLEVGSTLITTLAKFSIYTNGLALLNTKVNPKMMPALQGLRFLSMCWVIVGHRYINTLITFNPLVNLLDYLEWINWWFAVWVEAAPFAVDTFFVISGFLMSYLYLKSKKSGKRSNFHMAYLHRYLRLTPALAVLILFTAVLLHRVTNGPIWESSLSPIIGNCRKYWWLNLLYVQNIVEAESMCLVHSWYLAVDMQLFWISPFILYPLYRWPKFGFGILGLFFAASMVVPAIILALNGYSNAVFRIQSGTDPSTITDSFYFYYVPTYTRAFAYLAGILLGYDVANHKRKLTKKMVAINWTVASIFMLICGLATIRLFNTDIEYNVVLETVLAVFLRPLWSVSIAWIVYACTQGYGGPVTSFLSLPIFLPLSRLSYSTYLVHMVIQYAKNAAVQTSGRFTDMIMLDHFWADLVLSTVIALFVCLFFESPVVVLEKILKTPSRKPVKKESKKDVEGGIDDKEMAVN